MRVEVWYRPEIGDGRAGHLLASLRARGGEVPTELAIRDVYLVDGVPGLRGAELLDLVSDRVAQHGALIEQPGPSPPVAEPQPPPSWDLLLEVAYKPGVTDPVATTLRAALHDVLGHRVPADAVVQTARQYRCGGFSGGVVAPAGWFNPLIQSGLVITAAAWQGGRRPPLCYPVVATQGGGGAAAATVERFAVAEMSDAALAELSTQRLLALNAVELAVIRQYYRRPQVAAARVAAGLSAQATDVELEMLAQTWSEHCKHKIFAARIEYQDEGTDADTEAEVEVIDSIFATYIRATTTAVDRGDGFLRSVFTDDSGVIELDADTLLCFKVETHNSPSALDPYGGAITGIVGVNRDIMGTGRGARPIFNTNVLCFAAPTTVDVPRGLLPPRQVMEGVHRGIVDGGNQSGIPVVAGAFLFHPSFIGKPLVFCGTGGILPAHIDGQPAWHAEPRAGDLAVMVGGRIGRDGIHGATFSSLALDEASPLSAVQIGDPIVQKKMADFLIEARDRCLFRALTDNGAGGLSSSFGEMARDSGGIRLDLERAPLKYQGLQPWEILLSESQERMSLAVPPDCYAALAELAARRQVEVTAVGEFTGDGKVDIRYAGNVVALLELRFLHEGVPQLRLRARWPGAGCAPGSGDRPPTSPGAVITGGAAQTAGAAQAAAATTTAAVATTGAATAAPAAADPQDVLLGLLAEPNVASKEQLVRQYDHEVGARSIGKPFVGAQADGPSDGAVLQPRPDSARGVTVTHGICPWYSAWDAYHMAQCAVDEAVRAHVALGGDPDRMAALDNFCWPDPIAGADNPDGAYKLAQLVRAARGLHDACLAYRLPLISGKDSMKNDAVVDGRKVSVLPTLLVSLIGMMPDVRGSLSADFKRADDLLFVVGADRRELGCTAYARLTGCGLDGCPTLDSAAALAHYRVVYRAAQAGLIRTAHDLADGGLAVALAEACIGGRLGAQLALEALQVDPAAPPTRHAAGTDRDAPTDAATAALFSETPGRLLIAVAPAQVDAFGELFAAADLAVPAPAGTVTSATRLHIEHGGKQIVDLDVATMRRAWQTPI